MRKPILAVLCLALVCGYDLAAPLFASSDRPSSKPGWRFKDGTTPGAADKVEPPYILQKAPGQYAEMPRRQGLRGDVVVELEIGENGDVVNAVVTRSPDPALDANAVASARKWKYRSARLNGTPKASVVQEVVKPKLGWRFKDGTNPGANDKVEPPDVVTQVPAEYAIEPRKQRLQGDVGLDLEVNENGDVVNAVVTRSLHPELDANAVTAARKWTYRAARLNGAPKASLVEAIVKYQLR